MDKEVSGNDREKGPYAISHRSCHHREMDTSLYEIRKDLSRALAELHEAQQSYPDDPTLHAIDSLQSAVERLTGVLEEIHSFFSLPVPTSTGPHPVASGSGHRHHR